MRLVHGAGELRAAIAGLGAEGGRLGFVPTMGALHEGHLSLVRLAAQRAATVVVSVFVNPTQFDAADDLAAYPRDVEADLAALRALGASAPQVVFLPAVCEVYPEGAATTVRVAGLTDGLCGASRPGHFDGVATVVAILLNLVRPDLAVFGRKDYQQLQVIRRLAADLATGVEIVAAPTVREAGDGLALSSRNRRLTPARRAVAGTIPRALRAALLTAREDRGAGPRQVRAAALATLGDREGLELDYLEVVDPVTLAPPVGPPTGRLLVAVAARVGPVRLIDNVEIGDPDDEAALLRATG